MATRRNARNKWICLQPSVRSLLDPLGLSIDRPPVKANCVAELANEQKMTDTELLDIVNTILNAGYVTQYLSILIFTHIHFPDPTPLHCQSYGLSISYPLTLKCKHASEKKSAGCLFIHRLKYLVTKNLRLCSGRSMIFLTLTPFSKRHYDLVQQFTPPFGWR